jgi:hypothetical protein
MTTIVNTPPSEKSDSPMGWIVGLVILIVLIYLGYVYGLPALRNMQSGGVQINVPDSINVNVNPTK